MPRRGCRASAPIPSPRSKASASRRLLAIRGRRSRRDGRSCSRTAASGCAAVASVRNSTRVCACTPSTAEITSTAPSSTFSTRSTSAMKSGCPGVSIRLTVTSCDDERHDRGLDGDAAAAFEVEGVGLCGAVVDAADRVDDVGFVEQPLGEARLTRVYMCQNSQIQRSHGGACPADGGYVPSR